MMMMASLAAVPVSFRRCDLAARCFSIQPAVKFISSPPADQAGRAKQDGTQHKVVRRCRKEFATGVAMLT